MNAWMDAVSRLVEIEVFGIFLSWSPRPIMIGLRDQLMKVSDPSISMFACNIFECTQTERIV